MVSNRIDLEEAVAFLPNERKTLSYLLKFGIAIAIFCWLVTGIMFFFHFL
jgi:hypothetical protein